MLSRLSLALFSAMALCACGDDTVVPTGDAAAPSDATIDAPAADGSADSAIDAANDCVAHGGACVGVSSCLAAGPDGGAQYLSPLSCGGGSAVTCCFSSCAGTHDFQCCTATATFRPSCIDGKIDCQSGQTKCPLDAGTD